ncbi:ASCH domain [Arabidopsis thaliana x Arabidopsis arenosa]|uniref:ASCH domain n=1 Tax=Arabidopsis thaliana x Arabidopsis arenosa TaxID=1240361 RepID=A0A8T2AP65_9BRAS|nr:ASCH domain [Arabidopsis thaliana x Arabidopsis arenosa]
MEQPTSPGTKSVNLRECMESLLRFTLSSHVDESVPSFDLDLTRDFCLHLLEEKTDSTEMFQLTEKPAVYKLLARGLSECLASQGDKNPNLEKYKILINGLGHDLINMLKKVNFELHVQEPYFTQLKDGRKTVEGRCAVGDYMRISSGDFILFNKCLLLEVQDVHHYTSFSEMLRMEGLAKVLPGVESIEEGVQVYRNFYSEEKERMNGVVAIRVAKPANQPYAALAGGLSELKSTGIKSLLNDYTA